MGEISEQNWAIAFDAAIRIAEAAATESDELAEAVTDVVMSAETGPDLIIGTLICLGGLLSHAVAPDEMEEFVTSMRAEFGGRR